MPGKTKKENKKSKEAISWRAAEYQYIQKDIGWDFLVGIVSFLLVILALLRGNFFFAVFIIIAAVTVMFFAKRRPQIFDFEISEKGVAIGGNIFYDYGRLEGFTVRERPERLNEIVLKKKAALNPYLKIPADSKIAKEAEKFLKERLPEIEYQDSFIEAVSEWLGF